MQEFLSGKQFWISRLLSIVAGVLALTASVAGIFVPALYRDRPLVVPVWRATDWVTLVAALPLLAGALVLARRGSLRAVLLLFGSVYYLLYGYAFFVFGATLNELFVIYAAILALSLFALIFGLASLDVDAIGARFRARMPARWIGGFLLLVAVMVLRVWISKWIAFVMTGEPAIVDAGLNTEADYRVTAGIDLALLVGPFLLAGLWLWMRRPWGHILGVICTTHGVLLMAALTVGCFTTARAGMPNALANLIIWIPVGIGSLICLGLLLVNIAEPQTSGIPGRQASHAVG